MKFKKGDYVEVKDNGESFMKFYLHGTKVGMILDVLRENEFYLIRFNKNDVMTGKEKDSFVQVIPISCMSRVYEKGKTKAQLPNI